MSTSLPFTQDSSSGYMQVAMHATSMLDMLQRHNSRVLLADKLFHTLPSCVPCIRKVRSMAVNQQQGTPHLQHGVGLNTGQVPPVLRALRREHDLCDLARCIPRDRPLAVLVLQGRAARAGHLS